MSDKIELEALRLLRAFRKIPDPSIRRRLIDLVEKAANQEPEKKESN